MRTNLVVFSLVVALTLMASFGFAEPGAAMRISVPFDFYAGDQQLPAGEYTVQMGSGFLPTASVVTILQVNGSATCMLATQPGTDADLSATQLQFNKYGNKRFLSTVSIRGFKADIKMLKLERELRARAEQESDLVIIAQK